MTYHIAGMITTKQGVVYVKRGEVLVRNISILRFTHPAIYAFGADGHLPLSVGTEFIA